MPLDDYGSIIQSGMNLVPDYNRQLAFQVGLQSEKLQQQQVRQQLADDQQKAIRAHEFQTDLTAAMQNPHAQNISGLIMKYPEFADKLKSGWDVRDKAAKESDLTQSSEIYSAASSGNWELAAKLAHARHDADKAAGQADEGDDEFIQGIDAAKDGDQTQRKAVLGTLGLHLAAVAGPEHFATVYGALNKKDGGFTLDAGATRFDADGNVVARSPYIKGPDGSIAERDPTPGGQAPSAAAASGGSAAAIEHVLGNEGGYNPSDMNGAPVNFGINAKANAAELKKLGVSDIKNLTKDQAAQIYATKYWPQSGAENLPANMQAPYFDVYIRNPAFAKRALAESGGDPAKFMEASNAYFGKLAQTPKGAKYGHAWAARDAGNTAIATGTGQAPVQSANAAPPGYHWLVPPKGGDQYRILTPTETTQRGLDASQQYQLNTATGAVTGLGKREASATPPGNSDLTGPAYLADLHKHNPSLANQVQGVMDTRLAYPPATARSPQAQALRAAVLQVDPTYDEQAYKRRQTTIQQYTPGHAGPGQSMLSAATLINHLYDLAQAARDLPDHSTKAQNAISSWMASQTNQPWLIKFNEGRKFVASELPKFLEGKAPTEGQVREHMDSYSPSKGKSGIQTALSTDVDYLYGRYQPLLQAYKDNTGKDLNIDNYAPGQATRAKAAALEYYRANGALPVVVTSPAQAAKLPHGSVFVTPDGRIIRRH